MDNSEKILKLKKQNKNLTYLASGVGFAGGVGGVYYAVKKGKSNWTKVGFFILGSIACGMAIRLFTTPKILNNNAEIKNLESENTVANQVKEGVLEVIDAIKK